MLLSCANSPRPCATHSVMKSLGHVSCCLRLPVGPCPPSCSLQEQQQLFAAMQAQGIPPRYTHCMASFMPQDEFQYADQLARLAAGQADTHALEAARAAGSRQGQDEAPQQQQQQSLVSMPGWLVDLAKAVSADILGRPDSFRCGSLGAANVWELVTHNSGCSKTGALVMMSPQSDASEVLTLKARLWCC